MGNVRYLGHDELPNRRQYSGMTRTQTRNDHSANAGWKTDDPRQMSEKRAHARKFGLRATMAPKQSGKRKASSNFIQYTTELKRWTWKHLIGNNYTMITDLRGIEWQKCPYHTASVGFVAGQLWQAKILNVKATTRTAAEKCERNLLKTCNPSLW